MKRTDEIVNNPILKNIELGIDGGRATLHIGRWDGSVIWSWDCGFEHVSVAPFAKRITPSWDDMTKIKDIFWNDDEDVVQIHPRKSNYVNNIPNCLHLWRCTYREMPLPPSCLVGLRDGQTKAEFEQEVKEAYEIAERYKDKIWKDIKGYEGLYQVSNAGSVRVLGRYDANGLFRDSQMIKPIESSHGYYVVTLNKNGKSKQFRVHRLVAEAFIPNPDKLPMINHKDENKMNNCVENLEWCDAAYNNNYGNRLNKVAMKLGKAVIGIELATGKESFYYSMTQAAKETNSDHRKISAVVRGTRKKHNGRIWRYATEKEIREAYEIAGEKY